MWKRSPRRNRPPAPFSPGTAARQDGNAELDCRRAAVRPCWPQAGRVPWPPPPRATRHVCLVASAPASPAETCRDYRAPPQQFALATHPVAAGGAWRRLRDQALPARPADHAGAARAARGASAGQVAGDHRRRADRWPNPARSSSISPTATAKGTLLPAAGTPERLRCNYWLHYAEGSAMPPLLLKLVFSRVKTAPAPFFVRPIARGIAHKVESSFIDPQLEAAPGLPGGRTGRKRMVRRGQLSVRRYPAELSAGGLAARGGLDASYPRLAAFLERIHARPAYQRAPRARRSVPAWLNGSLAGRALVLRVDHGAHWHLRQA